MEKKCLECGDKILGRIDKKFCSDYCRNAYNNKLNKDSKNLVRNINNRLRKNYRILDSYPLTEGKTKTTKTRLMDKGFDFEYITNLYTTKKGTRKKSIKCIRSSINKPINIRTFDTITCN